MTPSEISRLLYIFFSILAALAALAIILTVIRRVLEKKVRSSMAKNSDSLVGKRALVMSVIRPSRTGSIRPLGTAEEEADRASSKIDADDSLVVYPAVSDQLISKGRVVRVTGGDANRYIVRPL